MVVASLPQDLSAPGVARDVVHAALHELQLGELLDVCVLVASELVTNAVQHGRPPLQMEIRHGPDRLIITVCDAGPSIVDDGPPVADHDSESGRGLRLVRDLADDVRWETLPGGGKAVVVQWRHPPPHSRRDHAGDS